MRLTFIRKTALSHDANCPALYRAEDGGYVVQGRLVVDPDTIRQAQDLGVAEALVWVPADVIDGAG